MTDGDSDGDSHPARKRAKLTPACSGNPRELSALPPALPYSQSQPAFLGAEIMDTPPTISLLATSALSDLEDTAGSSFNVGISSTPNAGIKEFEARSIMSTYRELSKLCEVAGIDSSSPQGTVMHLSCLNAAMSTFFFQLLCFSWRRCIASRPR